MAFAFKATSTVTGTALNATGTEPTGTAQNDIMVAFIICGQLGVLGAPVGWTVLRSGQTGTSENDDHQYMIAYIVRGASAPSLVFTTGTSQPRELYICTFSGENTSTPIDAEGTPAVTPATPTPATNPDPPSVTPVDAAALAICVGSSWFGSAAGGWGTPTGYTIRSRNVAGDSGVMASKQLSGTAPDNPSAFTNGAGASSNFAHTFTLKSSAGTQQTLRPDADLATTGWTTTPLFSKVNDSSDATVVTSTLA